MPQFDPTFFLSQIVWLAVILAIFFLLMTRMALPRIGEVVEARANQIAGDLDRARSLKAQTEEVVATYEASLAAARAEAGTLMAASQTEISRLTREREAAFAKELTVKVSQAEARIAAARDAVAAEVRDIALGVAQDVTHRLIAANVDAPTLGRAVDQVLKKSA